MSERSFNGYGKDDGLYLHIFIGTDNCSVFSIYNGDILARQIGVDKAREYIANGIKIELAIEDSNNKYRIFKLF